MSSGGRLGCAACCFDGRWRRRMRCWSKPLNTDRGWDVWGCTIVRDLTWLDWMSHRFLRWRPRVVFVIFVQRYTRRGPMSMFFAFFGPAWLVQECLKSSYVAVGYWRSAIREMRFARTQRSSLFAIREAQGDWRVATLVTLAPCRLEVHPMPYFRNSRHGDSGRLTWKVTETDVAGEWYTGISEIRFIP